MKGFLHTFWENEYGYYLVSGKTKQASKAITVKVSSMLLWEMNMDIIDSND